MDSSESDEGLSTEFNIYAGRSIADLDARSINFPSSRVVQLPTLKKCKCCGKLLDEAELSYELGDLEMAYIKYMRYIKLADIIKASPDYRQHQGLIFQIIGTDDYQKEITKRLELIVVSLKTKYEELAELQKRTNKVIKLHNPHKKPEAPAYFTPAGKLVRKEKPKSPSPSKSPSCGMNFSPRSPKTPPACPIPLPAAISIRQLESKAGSRLSFITCDRLFQMITAEKTFPDEILIDCRRYKDYFESRIKHTANINIDEKIICPGISMGIIENDMKADPVKLATWNLRKTVEHVILYDWDTDGDDPILDTPLHLLKQTLLQWDTIKYKSLKFLQGGFRKFVITYPKFTTNPNITLPSPKKPPLELEQEENEYSAIGEISLKDDSLEVDDQFLVSFTKKEGPTLKEMVEMREKLADKSLVIEQERLSLEKDLKCAIIASECADDEETKEKELEKVLELENEVLQLENASQDIAEESMILCNQICEVQECIPDAAEPLECKLKLIEEKECEAQQLCKKSDEVASEKRLSGTRETFTPSPITKKLDASTPIPTEVIKALTPTKPKPTDTTIRGITGLKNFGSTCYMNTILQCISNTNSLAEYFINRVYTNCIEPGDSPFVDTLAVLIRSLWSGKFTSIAPIHFFSAITNRHTPFADMMQEDAQEFLMLLIDWLHSDLRRESISMEYPVNINTAQMNWLDFVLNEPSDMLGLFYGQFKTTIKCEKCNGEISTYETFSMINLILPPGKGRFELTKCLDQYFNGEMIDYTCNDCCQKGVNSERAAQKLNITRLPPYLIIHLKRFGNDGSKRKNFIRFPFTQLKMDPYLAPSEAGARKNASLGEYNLYAIANHYGAHDHGHYNAFCKNSIADRWYKFDDGKVTPEELDDLDTSAAYILFYTKLPLTSPPEVALIE